MGKKYFSSGQNSHFVLCPPPVGGPSTGSADLTTCQLIKRFYLTPPDSSDTESRNEKLFLKIICKLFVVLSQLLRTPPLSCYNDCCQNICPTFSFLFQFITILKVFSENYFLKDQYTCLTLYIRFLEALACLILTRVSRSQRLRQIFQLAGELVMLKYLALGLMTDHFDYHIQKYLFLTLLTFRFYDAVCP